VKETRVISEQNLREMFADDTSWLGRSISDIDVLNVFPVSDGDCGIITIHSNLEEAYQASDSEMSSVTRAMTKVALVGAKDNSWVIPFQSWRSIIGILQ
jgi:dihydroxyacetone kinase-like predicted kinase